jgi:PAS domain S-box-containing protein
MTEDNIKGRLKLQSTKISDKLLAIVKVLEDHSVRPILINPLMQFDQDNLAMKDYLEGLTVLGKKGSFSIVSFDSSIFVGETNFNSDEVQKVLEGKEKFLVNIVDRVGSTLQFIVPIHFSGNVEGALIFDVMVKSEELFVGGNKDWNYLIKQDGREIKLNRNDFKEGSARSRSTSLLSDIVLHIEYDPFSYLKEKIITLAKLLLILSFCVLLFSIYFYKKGRSQLVTPHEELLKLKNELKKSNTINNSLINSSIHMIIGTDRDGVIRIFNKAAENNLGYQKSDMIDIQTPGLFHKDSEILNEANELSEKYGQQVTPGFEVFIYELLRGSDSTDKEWTYIRRDGSEFKARLIVSAIKGEESEVLGYLGIAEDITMLNLAREMESLARNELEQTAKMKSQFLANMSHEIRTPMNGILGMIDMMKETPLNSSQSEMINTMSTCGSSLLTILNDILDLSKIDAGKLELEEICFDINDCVDQSISFVSSLIGDKDIQILYEKRLENKCIFMGDVTRIRQILINYLSNGIKFTEEGQVRISVSIDGEKDDFYDVKVVVSDTGIGLSEDEISKLFKSFVQSDSSTTRKYGGTGLGLSICSKLAKAMGGAVFVSSVKDEGSSFGVKLPLKLGQDKISKSSFEETEDISVMAEKFPHKILVAEDNIVNQKLIRMIFKKMNYEIDVVNNGREVVEKIEEMGKDHYSILFMDIHMPEIDGIEATQIIFKRFSPFSFKVIALTANAFDEDRKTCLSVGMSDFLTKPMDRSELIRVLKSS